MRKNVASQNIAFQMTLATDGTTAVTSGTPTVYYTVDGGTQGTGSGTSTHEGNGQWSYVPAQAETNGDHVIFTMLLATAITQAVNVYPVAYDPTDATRLGLTALPNAAADAAGGLAISDAGGLDIDAKLANTNEITVARMGALTDWINGGRLDLLLDAIPTTAMRGTDGAYTGTPPTAAAVADAVWDELQSAHVTVGSFGIIASEIAAIPTTAMRGTDSAALASVCTEARLAELDAANLPADVDSILLDTAEIGTAGAGLTSIFTTAMTESYAADGVAPTPAQSLFLIQQSLTEVAISSTTETIKKLDGSTAAATLTLDSASAPTSKTRAT